MLEFRRSTCIPRNQPLPAGTWRGGDRGDAERDRDLGLEGLIGDADLDLDLDLDLEIDRDLDKDRSKDLLLALFGLLLLLLLLLGLLLRLLERLLSYFLTRIYDLAQGFLNSVSSSFRIAYFMSS